MRLNGVRIMEKSTRKVNKPNNLSINAYIVIGDANMGKSSTLRHLIGITKGCPFYKKGTNIFNNKIPQKWIRLVNGKDILVGMQGYSSLQERLTLVRAVDYVRFIQQLNPSVSNILLSLQLIPQNKTRRWASAQRYVSYFQRSGWNVMTVVLTTNRTYVQNNYYAGIFPNTNCLTVYSTRNGNPVYPTNVVASDVRRHFGWV